MADDVYKPMKKRKKKRIDADEIASENSTEVLPDNEPILMIDDTPAPKGKQVAVGMQFWLTAGDFASKARRIEVVGMPPGGATVHVRYLDTGQKKVLPLAAFQTAGRFQHVRAS